MTSNKEFFFYFYVTRMDSLLRPCLNFLKIVLVFLFTDRDNEIGFMSIQRIFTRFDIQTRLKVHFPYFCII